MFLHVVRTWNKSMIRLKGQVLKSLNTI